MIRIRFPADGDPAPVPADRVGVEVTSDPTVIAVEGEKNGSSSMDGVDRVLRPMFQRQWAAGTRLFRIVAVETRSGCNHECSFCPVSRSVDPRPAGELEAGLLQKIADELAALRFSGRVALFGNNEPFLDTRLPDVVALFRSRLPDVDLRVLTNGTRATPENVAELFEAGLSTLIVNNYTDGHRLIAPVRALVGASATLMPYDIRVSVRARQEVLTTRGGLAPNKPRPARRPSGFCALPFTDLHISYTGHVNPCCFDAHGRVSMGHVGERSLAEIWEGPRFARYRAQLLRSRRAGLVPCESCDFDGFRAPTPDAPRPLVRADLENWSDDG